MLRSARSIIGYHLRAIDGVIGKVKDILFDDARWKIRYLLVDTGRWLPGRQVLISPEAIGEPEWRERVVPVRLTRQQVEASPDLRTDEPVARQHEEALATYYRWAPYWMPGAGIFAGVPAPVEGPLAPPQQHGDPHLRSVKEVHGYQLRAVDDEIGHLEDLVMDTGDWSLRYLVVDTRRWLPGRRVLVSPEWVTRLDWVEGQVGVDLTRQQVQNSPEFDPSAPVNREYEEVLYDYYGRPAYWR